MKKLFLLSFALIIGFQIQAQNNPTRKFGVKSGKIIIKMDGSAKGSKTIYFDDYGDKYYEEEKSITEITMFGVTDRNEINKTLILNKEKYWNIDNVNGEYYKGTLTGYQVGKKYAETLSEAEQKELTDNIINGLGGQRLGNESVLGFDCEKISVMGINMWLYKGIALKSKGNIMGVATNEIATSFEENIHIPVSRFEPPADFKFTDLEASSGNLGQMDMFEEEIEEATENLYPVEYPYENFTTAVNGFNPEGHVRTMVMNQDGQYMALYNQGFTNMVVIIATSSKNMDGEEEEMNFESFTHKGKTIKYGEMDSEGMTGKGLLVPYDNHNMHIMLMSMPGKDKQILLNWLEELDF